MFQNVIQDQKVLSKKFEELKQTKQDKKKNQTNKKSPQQTNKQTNKTKQNKQNKTKQNKTKQNQTKTPFWSYISLWNFNLFVCLFFLSLRVWLLETILPFHFL